jgi:hypothetical protein
MTVEPAQIPAYRGCRVVLVSLRKAQPCVLCRRPLASGDLVWRAVVASLVMLRSHRLCVGCQAAQYWPGAW